MQSGDTLCIGKKSILYTYDVCYGQFASWCLILFDKDSGGILEAGLFCAESRSMCRASMYEGERKGVVHRAFSRSADL